MWKCGIPDKTRKDLLSVLIASLRKQRVTVCSTCLSVLSVCSNFEVLFFPISAK